MDQDRGMLAKLSPTTAGWLAWSLWVLALGFSLATLLLRLTANSWWNAGAFVALSTTGALIASRRPGNPIGWLYCAMGFLGALTTFAQQYAIRGLVEHPGSLPGAVYVAWLERWSLWFVFPAGIALLLLLFPTGRPASPRWRPLIWISVTCAVLMVVGSMFAPGQLSDALRPASGPGVTFGVQNPFGIEPLGAALHLADAAGRTVAFLVILIAAVGLVVRLLRARGDERQQLKWVAYVGSGIALGVVGTIFLGSGRLFGSPALQDFAFGVLLAGFVVGLPVATAIAVLKYRLYDIDLVINKTLLFGSMAAFITLGYVAIVVGIGHLVGQGGRPNLGLSILATAFVAVAFQPVRERVQRVANRLVYGKRATPYEVMADFSEQMAGALSVEDALPRMARAAATAVGASYGRVRLMLADGGERAATWPDHDGPVAERNLALPTMYGGDRLGEIAIAKPTGEPLLPAERKLLIDLAAQAGLVLHNVRLGLDLQHSLDEISSQAAAIRASRQRIVAAQDTERRRLEQTIRGGAEAQLVGIKADLHRIEQGLISDPNTAAAHLDQLTTRANDTLENLRDVARGIYPPLLRERGLAAALQAQVEKMHAPVRISTDGLGRYPSEAEGAIYFACLEAIRSATGPAAIHLEAAPGSVEFRIRAPSLQLDGRQQDIEDRIQALGGSVGIHHSELTGQIPIRVLEPVG
jgi:signal transduction histidine kinase